MKHYYIKTRNNWRIPLLRIIERPSFHLSIIRAGFSPPPDRNGDEPHHGVRLFFLPRKAISHTGILRESAGRLQGPFDLRYREKKIWICLIASSICFWFWNLWSAFSTAINSIRLSSANAFESSKGTTSSFVPCRISRFSA